MCKLETELSAMIVDTHYLSRTTLMIKNRLNLFNPHFSFNKVIDLEFEEKVRLINEYIALNFFVGDHFQIFLQGEYEKYNHQGGLNEFRDRFM